MLDALLRGKVSAQVLNMEDVLVSTVFGLMKLASTTDAGLTPLLRAAVFSDGTPLLAEGIRIESVDYEFWPWIKEGDCEGCEPDALLTIKLSGCTKVLLGIEAKLWSGKSSEADDKVEAPKDQLAREWDNLTLMAERQPNGKVEPALLYITSDIAIPTEEIDASEREFATKRRQQGRPQFRCAWVSWRKLIPLFDGAEKPLSDLAVLAAKLDLRYYKGINDPCIGEALWTFERGWQPYIDCNALPLWSYGKQ